MRRTQFIKTSRGVEIPCLGEVVLFLKTNSVNQNSQGFTVSNDFRSQSCETEVKKDFQICLLSHYLIITWLKA